VITAVVGLFLASGVAQAADLLVLEQKIPLGQVKGRIDHMAIDVGRKRLIVAELGNDTVGVVDLAGQKVAGRISGMREPQGVAYVPSADLIFTANAGDGAVRWFKAADLSPAGKLDLGDDADNIRFDARANQVLVGYGDGGLAALDPVAGRKLADIKLPAHPESFQLEAQGSRAFVNLPDAHQVGVVDRTTGRQSAEWKFSKASGNFPMALDEAGHHLLVVYRNAPTLAVFDTDKGSLVGQTRTCGDADDVFIDAQRQRVYISCGEGTLAVFAMDVGELHELCRIPTSSGARTSLFVPELDRLYLAVRASGNEPAAIWVFRPAS
jgi:sugar lactone lactonase YvrE